MEPTSANSPHAELAALREQLAHAEQRLAEAQSEIARLKIFEQIVESATDGVIVSDATGRLIYANPAVARLVGASSADELIELYGDGGGFSSPEEREMLQREILPRLLSEGQLSWTATVTRRDGSSFKGSNSSFVLRDEQGKVGSIAAFIRDLTEQLRTEEQLRASESYLRTVLDNVPIMLFSLNREGLFTFADGSGLVKLSLTADQLVGTSVFDLYAGIPEFILAVEEAFSGARAYVTTTDMATGVGFEHWLTAVRDDAGAIVGLIGVSIDISERMIADLERIALQEDLISAQRAALRELSTPLVPIADSVLAMPLVGSIDDWRAQQIMETLLEGIAQQQADTAILDITGVRVVDTQVADALLRVARAARLLGTRILLTGIGAEVAQTLVGLGADLSGITTASTLREGVALALASNSA